MILWHHFFFLIIVRTWILFGFYAW